MPATQEFEHRPVLFDEALDALAIKPDGCYVDGTFGRGGHARAILQQLSDKGSLFALDRDPQAIEEAERLKAEDPHFEFAHAPFSHLLKWAERWGIVGKVDGLLLDIGVSSPQLDDAQRGFSFRQQGPLDMRMNPEEGQSAAQWLATAEEKQIAEVIWQYGEERFSRRIAKAIVKARSESPIETTRQLQEIVARAHPRWEKGKDPATRTFQAIRIFINSELDELQACLQQAVEVLAKGGRLAVISFHSLEDRMVKQFIQQQSRSDSLPMDLPVQTTESAARLKRLGKMIQASEQEIQHNPRARSARLRVAEKLA